MTKIDVSGIVIEHIKTLRNASSQKLSPIDVFLFYGLPVLLGGMAFWFGVFVVSRDIYNISVTFFGIFIALFINIQVAVFGVFQRQWRVSDDPRIAELQQEKLLQRRDLLAEINSNISYLIVVSCMALVVFLILFVLDAKGNILGAMSAMIYFHFLLTLLMVVKRAHALFAREYRGE